jgi:hypothetical protein
VSSTDLSEQQKKDLIDAVFHKIVAFLTAAEMLTISKFTSRSEVAGGGEIAHLPDSAFLWP